MRRQGRAQDPARRRRGVALVEAALSLTAALMLIIGVTEIGVAVMIYQGAVERARAGARYAAVFPDDEAAIRNVVVYGNAAGTGSPLLGLSTAGVQIQQSFLDNESRVTGLSVRVQALGLVSGLVIKSPPDLLVRVSTPIEGVSP